MLLSRNGKWALLVPPIFSVSTTVGEPPQPNTQATLVNLENGEKFAVGMPLTADGAFVLASDGSVLQRVQGKAGVEIGVGKNGQLKSLPTVSGAISYLGMSDDAGTVLASRINPLAPGQPLTTLPVPDLIATRFARGNEQDPEESRAPGPAHPVGHQ